MAGRAHIGAVRDHALTLACLREGVPAIQARGYDDLSAETHARYAGTHVTSLDPHALRAALAVSTRMLIDEGLASGVAGGATVESGLAELT